jgi:hypothetical protein
MFWEVLRFYIYEYVTVKLSHIRLSSVICPDSVQRGSALIDTRRTLTCTWTHIRYPGRRRRQDANPATWGVKRTALVMHVTGQWRRHNCSCRTTVVESPRDIASDFRILQPSDRSTARRSVGSTPLLVERTSVSWRSPSSRAADGSTRDTLRRLMVTRISKLNVTRYTGQDCTIFCFLLKKESHYGEPVGQFLFILYRNTVPASQRTQCAFNGLVLCTEIIAVYCRNRMEHTNTLCGQKKQLFNVKPTHRASNTELET